MKLTPSPFAPAAFPSLPEVKGIRAATARYGAYEEGRDDIFLFEFVEGTSCAGVFTLSTTPSSDVLWCRQSLQAGHGKARGLVVNAGNSNAFTGAFGAAKNNATIGALTAAIGAPAAKCYLAATGVIGEPLPSPDHIAQHIPAMVEALGTPNWEACAKTFMTTDTYAKGAGAKSDIDGTPVAIAGIAKGSGMIAPNMGTLLAYIFTDAAIAPDVLDQIIREITGETFNAITVDSDTSTSDTFMIFATGASGAPEITERSDPRLEEFVLALTGVARSLAVQIVKDGEGASKFITVSVSSAVSDESAKKIAASIANSPLVKTALAASDANWGRIIMAIGKSGEPVNLNLLQIRLGDHLVASEGGRAPGYDEATASAICAEPDIRIFVDVGEGEGFATLYTCDLTHAYIDINGAYRT